MNEMKHIDQETLAVYALDALEPRRARMVSLHLDQCSNCQAILDSYKEVANGLLEAVPAVRPPIHLRTRVLRAAFGSSRVGGSLSLSRLQHVRLAPIALLISAVLLVVNVGLLMQVRQIRQVEQELSTQFAEDRIAQGLYAYPDVHRVLIQGEDVYGSAIYDDYLQVVVLYIWGLKPLADEQAYQAWLIDAEGRRSDGGLFTVGEGEEFIQVIVRAPEMIKSFQALGVTIEPEGGSEGPTGQKVLGIDL
jgi:anti-sigma-K factor RskA